MCCRKRQPTHYNKNRLFKSSVYTYAKASTIMFPSNMIKTSKYTLIDFLPKSLLAQFQRFANTYFLVIAILANVDVISNFSPITAILPLAFILMLSMGREAYEDYNRHKSDIEMNKTKCFIYKQQKMRETTWANLQVGDVIKIRDDDFFPSDIIPLTSGIKGGACYIETGSLDGEKNLKKK